MGARERGGSGSARRRRCGKLSSVQPKRTLSASKKSLNSGSSFSPNSFSRTAGFWSGAEAASANAIPRFSELLSHVHEGGHLLLLLLRLRRLHRLRIRVRSHGTETGAERATFARASCCLRNASALTGSAINASYSYCALAAANCSGDGCDCDCEWTRTGLAGCASLRCASARRRLRVAPHGRAGAATDGETRSMEVNRSVEESDIPDLPLLLSISRRSSSSSAPLATADCANVWIAWALHRWRHPVILAVSNSLFAVALR